MRKELPLDLQDLLYWYKAELVRVVDGDTIIVNIDLGLNGQRNKVRLRFLEIDAAEMRGSEAEQGEAAKQHLKQLLPPEGGTVVIHTHKDVQDNWGRLLAEVFFGGRNIGHQMLEDGYAKRWER